MVAFRHSKRNNNKQDVTPVIRRCKRIIEYYLNLHDLSFSIDIKALGNEVYIPLIRWVKCMLSREFHICYVLSIWDVILANSNPLYDADCNIKADSLHMLDFVCLSMILFLKNDSKILISHGEELRQNVLSEANANIPTSGSGFNFGSSH